MAMAEATQPSGDRVNRTAYNLAFDTPLPFFQHLNQSPSGADMFAGYMSSLDVAGGTAQHHLLRAFDWAALGDAHVVDHALPTPPLHGAGPPRRDPPSPSPSPRSNPNPEPIPIPIPNPTHRPNPKIHLTPHDFFTPQPPPIAQTANIYLLRRILHNWPDHHAIQILQHLVDAMSTKISLDRQTQHSGSKSPPQPPLLFIMDTILPASPGEITAYQEGLLRMRDLVMGQSFNSGERGWEGWVRLLRATTPPLRVVRPVVKPVGSHMSGLVLGVDVDVAVDFDFDGVGGEEGIWSVRFFFLSII
ncbi:hypothetical protein BO70DRAFT_396332 [Aspergillus heteromorphus CBS 117.55]|uniref:O-methyltransferase domain-containing protein n=1 Tax=Aspergillus heteromorphus CBS 117.55 TaxID=1448321 RepID=A0A317WCZ7_9EURO|nr:uncharacterized protein BO70DRAFT_396332 [Aspergillus heteromorphus CBS 117.55]PWY82040.1 hypothetical protein BO70DRAFT_396332 [Aspergillus heteromorphus CBS 117.55]